MLKKKNNLLILIITLSFLFVSCGETAEESAENVFADLSIENPLSSDDTSNDNSMDENSFDESMDDDTTESFSDEELLNIALNNTFLSRDLFYKCVSSIELNDNTASIDSTIYNINNNYFSTSSLYMNNSCLWEKSHIYYNGSSFVEDEKLSKSKFLSSKENFFSYLNDNSFYYTLFEHGTTPILINANYEYTLTEKIINERFINELKSLLSIQNLTFESGFCTLYIENQNSKKNIFISEINANISTIATLNGNEQPLEININIQTNGDKQLIIPNADEYISYENMSEFLYSKSFYILSNKSSYEISTESRVYYEKNNKKTFSDIKSDFATDFTKNTLMSFKASLSDEKSLFYEKHVYNNQEYILNPKSNSSKDKYIITNFESQFTSDDSLKTWTPDILNFSNISEYTETEIDSFIKIDFVYNDIFAKNLIINYQALWNKYFPDFKFLPKEIEQDIYYISQTSGSITLRKEDNMVIDYSLQISLNKSGEEIIKLITSFEVIAIGEDVTVLKPQI